MFKSSQSSPSKTRQYSDNREFVTGIWPPEFERILNGESAAMLAQDAQLGKL